MLNPRALPRRSIFLDLQAELELDFAAHLLWGNQVSREHLLASGLASRVTLDEQVNPAL